MRQTIEDAAKEYLSQFPWEEGDKLASHICEFDFKAGFKAGAEWQAKQSPWIKVGDRNNPAPNDKPCLLLLEDGTVVDERSDWEEKCLLVLAYMPIPSFDEILEFNKDVLQRMKENGD